MEKFDSQATANPMGRQLTDDEVIDIRQRGWDGEKLSDMVGDYPVSRNSIRRALAGDSYQRLNDEEPPVPAERWAKSPAIAWANREPIGEDRVSQFRKRAREGESIPSIAEDVEHVTSTVRAAIKGRTYPNAEEPPLTSEELSKIDSRGRSPTADPAEVRQRRDDGESVASIADAVGLSKSRVYQILANHEGAN